MTDQRTKPNSKPKTALAWRDIIDCPPDRFALPEDGRQSKHLCKCRKALAVVIARYAKADGSNAFPSASSMMKATGSSRATTFRLLSDLKTLGVMTDGDLSYRNTRTRVIHVPPVSSSIPDPSHLQEPPVSSSTPTCPIFGNDPSHLQTPPVSSSSVPVSSSRQTHNTTNHHTNHQNQSPSEPLKVSGGSVGPSEEVNFGMLLTALKELAKFNGMVCAASMVEDQIQLTLDAGQVESVDQWRKGIIRREREIQRDLTNGERKFTSPHLWTLRDVWILTGRFGAQNFGVKSGSIAAELNAEEESR
jgi:hypothetical protein